MCHISMLCVCEGTCASVWSTCYIGMRDNTDNVVCVCVCVCVCACMSEILMAQAAI